MIAISTKPERCWAGIGMLGGDGSCPELPTQVHCRNCPVFADAARGFFDRAAPDDYASTWNDRLSKGDDHARNDDESVLVFRLGNEWLAIPTRVLVEVSLVKPIHRVPHRTNSTFAGLVAIRGQLELCASLHGVLGVEPSSSENPRTARLVMVEDRSGRWAFRADQVLGIEPIARASLRNVPGTLANAGRSHTLAVFEFEGRHVGLLDADRVFAAFRRLGT